MDNGMKEFFLIFYIVLVWDGLDQVVDNFYDVFEIVFG
jgi:hypothetical protein